VRPGIQGAEEIKIMPWYYANNNQRLGPVSDTEFARLAREKVIRDDTLVWQHGMPEWKNYAEIAPTFALQEKPVTPAVASPVDAAAILAEHPVELNYAGFWVRAGAKIIDLVIINILFLIVAQLMQKMPAMPVDSSVDELKKFMDEMSALSRISIGISLVYSWLFIWRFQATPGKLIFGLKIVRADGSRLGPLRILFRFLAELLNQILFGFGYLLAASDDQKRTMHDFMCDTRVIKKTRD
jgi:uncharacterized RDD family membrane protein YckC